MLGNKRSRRISSPGTRTKSESEKCRSVSRVRLFATHCTVTYQAPPFMGFSRQECWSGLPFPSPRDLPTQESNPGLPHCRQTLYRLSHQASRPCLKQPQLEKVHVHQQRSSTTKNKWVNKNFKIATRMESVWLLFLKFFFYFPFLLSLQSGCLVLFAGLLL